MSSYKDELEALFKEEMELIENELNETDKLYNELKSHYDNVLNSRNAGTLKFLADQSKTLVSLRSHKLGSIKDKVSLKKDIIELDLKEKNFKIRSEGEGDLLSDFKAIADAINAGQYKPSKALDPNNHLDSGDIDDIIAKKLDDIEDEEKVEEVIEEEIVDDNITLCTDRDGNLYYLNIELGEIIDKEIDPSLKVTVVSSKEDPNEEYGLLSTGEEIPLVEFE